MADDPLNPGPCVCGARWYYTTAGRITIDHFINEHNKKPATTEPTFAERRAALEHPPLPYPDD